MTLNSSPSNTMSPTTTSTTHEKPADTIEKESPNSSKMIKIKFQTLRLMIMLNRLKHKENIFTVALQCVPNYLQEKHQHINNLGEICTHQSKHFLHQEKKYFFLKKMVKVFMLHRVTNDLFLCINNKVKGTNKNIQIGW